MKRLLMLILGLLSICLNSYADGDEKLDATEISQASGFEATMNQSAGVFKIKIPRNIHASINGTKVSPSMGLTTSAQAEIPNFQALMWGRRWESVHGPHLPEAMIPPS